jgi:6-phosphogluconolactonase
VANQSAANNVSAFTINSLTGALTPAGTVTAGLNPGSVTVDSNGRRAYVANQGSNDVSAFTIDSVTGTLTAAGTFAGSAPASGPVSVITSGQVQ